MSVATKHTGHDRFIASCGAIPSQISPPLFTELRTFHMTLRTHVGASEFWSPVTPGQAGSAPAESSIEFRFLAKSALFYCVFLRRLSRNKARERHAVDALASHTVDLADQGAATLPVGDLQGGGAAVFHLNLVRRIIELITLGGFEFHHLVPPLFRLGQVDDAPGIGGVGTDDLPIQLADFKLDALDTRSGLLVLFDDGEPPILVLYTVMVCVSVALTRTVCVLVPSSIT